MEGGFFILVEVFWGIVNGWLLYGGVIGEQDYQVLVLGLGCDLVLLGVFFVDVIYFCVMLLEGSVYGDGIIQGNLFCVSYVKDFDDIDSCLMFVGYCFFEENYMMMDEFIDMYNDDNDCQCIGYDKEMYILMYSQNFLVINVNVYINYIYCIYWN